MTVRKPAFAIATALLMALASVAADSHSQSGSGAGTERISSARISDVEIAIAARACLVKGMKLHVVRKNGKPVATKVGALSRSQLAAFIEDHI